MLSLFDIFKIGIGPSSSHTVGPMKAAHAFIETLQQQGQLNQITRLAAHLHGSLALTGRGHHTDQAILMGLAGYLPETVDTDAMPAFLARVKEEGALPLALGAHKIPFAPTDLQFHARPLPRHENGLRLLAFAGEALLFSQTYYSVGGGFIVTEQEFDQPPAQGRTVPYPFDSAQALLDHCQALGVSIAHLMRQNEASFRPDADTQAGCEQLWQVMAACIRRGCHTEGLLPGPLKVVRRAAPLYRHLRSDTALTRDPMAVVDWVNCFALAVSEENAAGGRMVTAPTNGAAGIIPAVLAYYDKFVHPMEPELACRFLLTAAAVGLLYKMNASLSGAEVGCQGEVGVACSMAAAGLTELMSGSPEQVCQAAEIAMEHNLGLTCDPVGGQVQVPCIERNAIAAVKAINASRMAMRRISGARVSLDKVIATMYDTGKDMDAKYRETSQGGLAAKLADCD
ncbi:MAG: L-serine ammonia-lyase [Aeromonadaceae bacterium]|nr:L-serine ammonia-lyase [Aeromonadaceae bacterium]